MTVTPCQRCTSLSQTEDVRDAVLYMQEQTGDFSQEPEWSVSGIDYNNPESVGAMLACAEAVKGGTVIGAVKQGKQVISQDAEIGWETDRYGELVIPRGYELSFDSWAELFKVGAREYTAFGEVFRGNRDEPPSYPSWEAGNRLEDVEFFPSYRAAMEYFEEKLA